jgi:hypothetical protein
MALRLETFEQILKLRNLTLDLMGIGRNKVFVSEVGQRKKIFSNSSFTLEYNRHKAKNNYFPIRLKDMLSFSQFIFKIN